MKPPTRLDAEMRSLRVRLLLPLSLVLGIIGIWGDQERGARAQQPRGGNEGAVKTMDGGTPVPPPGR